MRNFVGPQEHGNHPLFSIIVLCWNSEAYLQTCLQALNQQSFKDFEFILVDNGSSEPVTTNAFAEFPELDWRLVSFAENLGFAKGNNIAIKEARGKYVVLLNSDAFPEPNWLEEIFKAIQRYPNHFFASRIIMANEPELLDSEGDEYHLSGIAWHRSFRLPCATTTAPEGPVFSACGAAAVYPKAAFDHIGGFDEDFFAFYEDVDLGFRMRLAGYECIYLPTAIVHHVGSGSTGPRSKLAAYYNQRNMIWAFIKNMPGWRFYVLLPFHILTNFLLIVNAAFHGQGGIYFKAKVGAVRGLKSILGKRADVQINRKVADLTVIKKMNLNLLAPINSSRTRDST